MEATETLHTSRSERDSKTQRPRQKVSTVAKRFSTVLWVFVVMSMVGLLFETIQHIFEYQELESRAGLIWGPFSPIYGFAAVVLTLALEPLAHKSTLFIFVVAALVGGAVEYAASFCMEMYWGVVAWSYLEMPFNLHGRTSLFHCVVWGTLGALWVRFGLPFAQSLFDRINLDGKKYRIITTALALFMAANIAMTMLAMFRAEARVQGVPATTPIEQFCDEHYPNEVLQARFENMGGIGIP